MTQPLVSVVLATFNGVKYLEAQLKSISDQSYDNLEIIICDDCSSDGTQEMIRNFASGDKRVSYFLNEKNLGVNKNFEAGFLRAKGEFISIADQDDIWLPDKLEKQLSLFTSPEIVLTHSASVRFTGKKLPEKKFVSSWNMYEGNDVRKLLLRNSVSGHNIIFRKTLLNNILPIPPDVYYDWWIVQTAACTGSVAATPRVLAYQRSHSENVTVRQGKIAGQDAAQYFERKAALNAFLQLKGLKETDRVFIETLRKKFILTEKATFSKELYDHLMKNRAVLFFYKKGVLKYFSQRKAAIRMSSK